jgi:hypothetical protein
MSYTFKILTPPLHPTALVAIEWFKRNWGIHDRSIRIEEAVEVNDDIRPTFSAKTSDNYTLCVEVGTSVYPSYISRFVLACRDACRPVKLYIAVEKGTTEVDYSQRLREAKRAGVGLIEVDSTAKDCEVLQSALALSLAGCRPVDPQSFPRKYRVAVVSAEHSFRDGNPAKACSVIYDELESAFRKFAVKASKKGWCNCGGLDIEKAPWANLITSVERTLDRAACGCPELTPAFMARIHGVTPFRNDSGHKPANVKRLQKRDRELRTRFEGAADLLRDFLDATRALHL